MEAVWPDSIVEENNLAQAIWKLRQVFGETPGSHSYIVTVPGRGYRFVAEVNKRNGDMVSRVPLDSTTTPTSVQGPTEADPTADRDQLLPKARHGTSRSDWRIFGAAIAAIIVVGLAVLFFARYRSLPASVRAPSSPAPAALSYQPLRGPLRRALRCCHLKIGATKKRTLILRTPLRTSFDPLIQHFGFKSDLAHFHAAISEQTCKSPRDREAARCREHS